jgi:hypothetical protein
MFLVFSMSFGSCEFIAEFRDIFDGSLYVFLLEERMQYMCREVVSTIRCCRLEGYSALHSPILHSPLQTVKVYVSLTFAIEHVGRMCPDAFSHLRKLALHKQACLGEPSDHLLLSGKLFLTRYLQCLSVSFQTAQGHAWKQLVITIEQSFPVIVVRRL